MIPLRSHVKADFLGLLDDTNGATFTDAMFQLAFRAAFDALFQGFLTHQCPRIQTISQYNLTANTTSLTPATAGLTDCGDIDELEERAVGSTDRYTPVDQVDKLTQRDAMDRLLEFTWRLDTFYFIGATTARDLRITSESSGTAPTDDNTAIGVDGSLSFLSYFAVGRAGRRKGYDEIAAECMDLAVGPRYSQGIIGGELWRLISSKVREMQNVTLQQRRYGSGGSTLRRRVPYIRAAQPQGVAMAPAQFSSALGTVTGAIDGVNATFYLSYPVATANIYRSGVLMTNGSDVTFGANQIVFAAGQIPQPGDVITAQGWL